jgi:serine/threonine-protein kinase RsbW
VTEQTGAGDPGTRKAERVALRLPPDSAYLAVLDFTLDEIEDLRIAVDEACALLLPRIAADGDLTCVFTIEADTLAVEVSARTTDAEPPRRDSFAWTVLSALAGEVDARTDGDGRVRITLRKQRGAVVGT